MPGKTATILTAGTIEQYRNWCIARGRSGNTVKAYASDLEQFLKAAGDETGSISSEEYEELAMSWLNLSRQVMSPKTINRRLTSLRGFARWMGIRDPLHEYIPPQPGKPVAHPLPDGIEDVFRMLNEVRNNEQEALVALIGLVGCRISEARTITTDCFNLGEMLVTIRGKGDKTRVVPLSDRAWEHVMAAYVLAVGKDDHRLISYQDRFARQVIKNLGKRAGVRREVASHDLRATFATEALAHCGNNVRVVQELLGHSSVTTTEVYTGVRIKQMKDAVQF